MILADCMHKKTKEEIDGQIKGRRLTDAESMGMLFDDLPDITYDADACKTCPNHPKNGGSGVCFCTLGPHKIT